MEPLYSKVYASVCGSKITATIFVSNLSILVMQCKNNFLCHSSVARKAAICFRNIHSAAGGKEPNPVALSLLNAQLSKMSPRTNIAAPSIRKLQELPTVYHLVEAD